jgi:hypothetical protein
VVNTVTELLEGTKTPRLTIFPESPPFLMACARADRLKEIEIRNTVATAKHLKSFPMEPSSSQTNCRALSFTVRRSQEIATMTPCSHLHPTVLIESILSISNPGKVCPARVALPQIFPM